MDHANLVRRATTGDVDAFVELTRRFQHFAFGSALALVRDFQQAEDVVQEAFLAAWSALPNLADPAAFPGWLRTIVRHHAFRILRRRDEAALPLDTADRSQARSRHRTPRSSSASRPPRRWPPSANCPTRCASRRCCSSCTNARSRTSPPFSICR
jgi:DNA-directed RNA polymerase specialized sigma24 family protein